MEAATTALSGSFSASDPPTSGPVVMSFIGELAVWSKRNMTVPTPPLYLFPELAPFIDETHAQQHHAASLDLERSHWQVNVLHDSKPQGGPADADAAAAQQSAQKRLAAALARNAPLHAFATSSTGVAPSDAVHIPTSQQALLELQALLQEADVDEDSRTDAFSQHFLNFLAHQRVQQLREDVAHTRALKTNDAATTPSKRHRTEAGSATDAAGAPSEDPWDPSRNAAGAPSIATPVALEEQCQLFEAVGKVIGSVWRPSSSVGVQTDLQVPGTNPTVPTVALPGEDVVAVPDTNPETEEPHATLAVLADDDQQSVTRVIPLHRALHTFGRRSVAACRTPGFVALGELCSDDKTRKQLSLEHFVVSFVLNDAGSSVEAWLLNVGRNGVRVNNRWTMSRRLRLADGDVISVAGIRMRFDSATLQRGEGMTWEGTAYTDAGTAGGATSPTMMGDAATTMGEAMMTAVGDADGDDAAVMSMGDAGATFTTSPPV